jgi:hypothetical protein
VAGNNRVSKRHVNIDNLTRVQGFNIIQDVRVVEVYTYSFLCEVDLESHRTTQASCGESTGRGCTAEKGVPIRGSSNFTAGLLITGGRSTQSFHMLKIVRRLQKKWTVAQAGRALASMRSILLGEGFEHIALHIKLVIHLNSTSQAGEV